MGQNKNRRKYILGKERVQEIRRKHARRCGGRQKIVAPIVESPVAPMVSSPITSPTLPILMKLPTPAPVTPTPALVLLTPRPVAPTPTLVSLPIPTVGGADAPSAPSSPVAH